MANTIEQNLQTIIDIKQNIKTAIENKGITVGDVSFTEYANKIGEISSGGITTIDVAAAGIKFGNSTFTEIPSYFDFSGNFTSIASLFQSCSNLTTIPLINCENVTAVTNAFNICRNVTNMEGLTDLGKAFTSSTTVNIKSMENLTVQSCLNIFNTVYDMYRNSSGVIPVLSMYKGVYDSLTSAQIAILTSKDWTISTY